MYNGAELAGATGARAPVLFLPRPEILGHILYVLSRFSGQIPEIPRPRPVVHLHYLGHFGASAHTTKRCSKRLKNKCKSINESDDLAHTHF